MTLCFGNSDKARRLRSAWWTDWETPESVSIPKPKGDFRRGQRTYTESLGKLPYDSGAALAPQGTRPHPPLGTWLPSTGPLSGTASGPTASLTCGGPRLPRSRAGSTSRASDRSATGGSGSGAVFAGEGPSTSASCAWRETRGDSPPLALVSEHTLRGRLHTVPRCWIRTSQTPVVPSGAGRAFTTAAWPERPWRGTWPRNSPSFGAGWSSRGRRARGRRCRTACWASGACCASSSGRDTTGLYVSTLRCCVHVRLPLGSREGWSGMESRLFVPQRVRRNWDPRACTGEAGGGPGGRRRGGGIGAGPAGSRGQKRGLLGTLRGR